MRIILCKIIYVLSKFPFVRCAIFLEYVIVCQAFDYIKIERKLLNLRKILVSFHRVRDCRLNNENQSYVYLISDLRCVQKRLL